MIECNSNQRAEIPQQSHAPDSNRHKVETLVAHGKGLAEQDQLEAAIACYRQAIVIAPDCAEAHYELGTVLLSLARYDEAIESFKHDINLKPDYSQSYYYLREAVEKQNQLAAAKQNYENASDFKEQGPKSNYLLGQVMAQQHRFDEATSSYLRSIELDPNQAQVHYELGNVLSGRGMLDQAAASYRQAISLKPDFVLAYIQLAHVYALQGKAAEAGFYNKQALEITSRPPLQQCTYPQDIDEAFSADLKSQVTCTQDHEQLSESALPIIVFYRELYLDSRLSALLPYCLAQAKRCNPRSEIILFGDSTHHYKWATHAYILDYYSGAEAFSRVYKHIARDVRLDYLLFCFQRWFILKDFMKANRINRCLHIDPDVMLFTDITSISRQYREFDFALSAHPDFGVCGHFNFVNRVEAIEQYCDFVYQAYAYGPSSSKKPSAMIDAIWHSSQGYITDMTAYAEFAQNRPNSIANLSAVCAGSVWDADVSQSHGFEMRKGLKNIYWKEDEAFCRQLGTGKEIRFHALHFCARAKRFMKNAFLKQPLTD